MRAFGRDLIRGGHYGQRSCEPHLKAEHMAAPTNAAYVKKALANSEPSTHGTERTWQPNRRMSAFGDKADLAWMGLNDANDPKRTLTPLPACWIEPLRCLCLWRGVVRPLRGRSRCDEHVPHHLMGLGRRGG